MSRPAQIRTLPPGWKFDDRDWQAYIAWMADKPAPTPTADDYSDEEAAKRTDATIRAMIGMKPKPQKTDRPIKSPGRSKRPQD